MSILPYIFIQNIIILYETINGTKYTCVIIPPPSGRGFGRIDINDIFCILNANKKEHINKCDYSQ